MRTKFTTFDPPFFERYLIEHDVYLHKSATTVTTTCGANLTTKRRDIVMRDVMLLLNHNDRNTFLAISACKICTYNRGSDSEHYSTQQSKDRRWKQTSRNSCVSFKRSAYKNPCRLACTNQSKVLFRPFKSHNSDASHPTSIKEREPASI